MNGRMFPIMRYPAPGIPWAVLAPHERQAQRNHGQSLKRLAQRGGLSPAEAVAVITGKGYGEIGPDDAAARAELQRLVDKAMRRLVIVGAEDVGVVQAGSGVSLTFRSRDPQHAGQLHDRLLKALQSGRLAIEIMPEREQRP
jgi:hypothetical protein